MSICVHWVPHATRVVCWNGRPLSDCDGVYSKWLCGCQLFVGGFENEVFWISICTYHVPTTSERCREVSIPGIKIAISIIGITSSSGSNSGSDGGSCGGGGAGGSSSDSNDVADSTVSIRIINYYRNHYYMISIVIIIIIMILTVMIIITIIMHHFEITLSCYYHQYHYHYLYH